MSTSNESHHKTYFEIFFLAGGWVDRDFLGVGFILMCRGVPTSVQTLTPTKWKQSVQVMCALNSLLLQYLKYLTYKLRPFQCGNWSCLQLKRIWKSWRFFNLKIIYFFKNSLKKYTEGILKLQSPVLSSQLLLGVPYCIKNGYYYFYMSACTSSSIHL